MRRVWAEQESLGYFDLGLLSLESGSALHIPLVEDVKIQDKPIGQ